MRVLILVAVLLLVLLVAPGMRWAVNHYTRAPQPDKIFDDPRLSFRPAAHLARRAVQAFRALPGEERRALRDALSASVADLEGWQSRIEPLSNFICLGERHDPAVRRFLGIHVLPLLEFDVLMLEAGTHELQRLLAARRRGDPVSLLQAPLDPLLDAAARQETPAALAAIDDDLRAGGGPRDTTAGASGLAGREERLVRNLAQHWRAGGRHVVVFGALHCRDIPGWMFHRLAQAQPRIAAAGMHGVVVLARYQESSAQILFYLMEEIGLGASVFTIPDVSRFPHQVQAWLPPTADALAGYDGAIFFDERALSSTRGDPSSP